MLRFRGNSTTGTWIPALLLTLVLAGCAPAPVAPVAAPERGMIYGHIAVPGGLRQVYLHEVGKAYVGNINLPRGRVLRDGSFVFVNLEPGDYYVAGFDDGQAPYWLSYDEHGPGRSLLRLPRRGMLFAGSFRVDHVEAPAFGRGSFDIARVREPDERRVLRKVRPLTEGTAWAGRIDRRLQQLP